MYLASQGGGRKGDLSRFIEEAVRAHILELSAEQAKAANVNVSEDDLTAIVAEAVQWARRPAARRSGYQCPAQCVDLAPWPSRPIYRAWRTARFEIVTSVTQLDELRRASRYEKFKAILQPHHVGAMVNNLQRARVLEHLPTDIEATILSMCSCWRWPSSARLTTW